MTNTVPQSFPVQSGSALELPITVTDRNDAIVDLTGASVRFMMARKPGRTLVLDSDASPALVTAEITTPLAGLLTVTITDENTEPLIGDYYYEVVVTDAFGNASPVTRGWITFVANLT